MALSPLTLFIAVPCEAFVMESYMDRLAFLQATAAAAVPAAQDAQPLYAQLEKQDDGERPRAPGLDSPAFRREPRTAV